MSIKCIYPNLKIQLKARFRLQEYLGLKNKNLNQPKKSDLQFIEEKKSPKPKKNKSIITNFHKYTIKTNLLKKIVSNMSTNELFKKEKDCSMKCDDTIKEIETYKNLFQKLPKIEQRRINLSNKNIKIHKIKSNNGQNEKYINSELNMAQCQSMPTISSSKKITLDNNDNIKNRENSCYSRVKIRKTNKSAETFNIKQNFTIIKYGGIKYNNSIFRIKNMNHLVPFKSV